SAAAPRGLSPHRSERRRPERERAAATHRQRAPPAQSSVKDQEIFPSRWSSVFCSYKCFPLKANSVWQDCLLASKCHARGSCQTGKSSFVGGYPHLQTKRWRTALDLPDYLIDNRHAPSHSSRT